jgi:hypothetical protein
MLFTHKVRENYEIYNIKQTMFNIVKKGKLKIFKYSYEKEYQ